VLGASAAHGILVGAEDRSQLAIAESRSFERTQHVG
jgi:hypothetical protein